MRKAIKNDFGLYSILTDPVRGYDYMANLLVEAQVAFLQLRMKDEDKFKILKTAENIRKITQGSNTIFIVNDFVDIAYDCGADGVHLGQDDEKADVTRALLGEDAIIGLSTHNIDQTKSAQNEPVDYIGVGPVYATPTKNIPDPVLGLDKMKEMLAASKLPAVCIGGIDLPRIKDVLAAGAKNFCVVRLLNQAQDPRAVLKEILALTTRHGG